MEAAYPRGLCDAIANIVADRLFSFGVVPVSHTFDGPDLSMNSQVRAAAGHPLKASKLPLWAPEYKSVFTIDVAAGTPEPPSRHLIDDKLADAITASSGESIPDHTIFLASTPLVCGESGSKSGKSDRGNEEADEIDRINSHPPAFNRWKLAVKWQPDEFVKEACKLGHPFGSKALLPSEIRNVIDEHFNRDWQDIVEGRIDWCRKWTKDLLDLQKEERGLHASCHPDVGDIIQGKRLLLWQRMLLDVGYVDSDLPLQFLKGFNVVGEVPACGAFPKPFVPALISGRSRCPCSLAG